MNECSLPGLKLVKLEKYHDDRGDLLPINFDSLAQKLNSPSIKQANITSSRQGVIRGMHWQREPSPQGKLIKVLFGKILDIVIDIRRESVTFGKFFTIELEDNDEQALWIPAGFAHGFQTLSIHSKVIYFVNAPFDVDRSEAINPFDQQLSLPWDASLPPILSNKDESAPDFLQKFGQ